MFHCFPHLCWHRASLSHTPQRIRMYSNFYSIESPATNSDQSTGFIGVGTARQ
jgi:hypothetical protein